MIAKKVEWRRGLAKVEEWQGKRKEFRGCRALNPFSIPLVCRRRRKILYGAKERVIKQGNARMESSLRPCHTVQFFLQRNSTLKRCKCVTNVWYVKNILANCDGNLYLPIFHLPRVLESHCKLQEKLHCVTGPLRTTGVQHLAQHTL